MIAIAVCRSKNRHLSIASIFNSIVPTGRSDWRFVHRFDVIARLSDDHEGGRFGPFDHLVQNAIVLGTVVGQQTQDRVAYRYTAIIFNLLAHPRDRQRTDSRVHQPVVLHVLQCQFCSSSQFVENRTYCCLLWYHQISMELGAEKLQVLRRKLQEMYGRSFGAMPGVFKVSFDSHVGGEFSVVFSFRTKEGETRQFRHLYDRHHVFGTTCDQPDQHAWRYRLRVCRFGQETIGLLLGEMGVL